MRLLFFIFLCLPSILIAQKKAILPAEIQLRTALLPLPETERATALVYGYDVSGKLTTLQEGSGKMVCLADDPSKEGISVACYAGALEPFMARGRELLNEGKTPEEQQAIRAEEVATGTLKMPEAASMMYVYYGPEEAYDPASGDLDGKFRYVVYIPFATAESTGLPDKPHSPGMPWLMDPGTHKAHIMIGPFN